MHNFRKAILASISFVLCLTLMIVGIVEYNVHSREFISTHDADLRASYSGTIDTLFVGDSLIQCAIQTSIIDKELDCNSYNLTGGSLPTIGCYMLIQEEASRNPVKTVILNISNDAILDQYEFNGVYYAFTRFSSFIDRLKFLALRFNVKEFGSLLSQTLLDTYYGFKRSVTGNVGEPEEYFINNKGSVNYPPVDVSMPENEIIESYDSENYSLDYDYRKIDEVRQIIEYCHNKDIRIIIVLPVVSDNLNWRLSNRNDYYQTLKRIADECECQIIDFNLLKSRFLLFSDKNCYKDYKHLSYEGSAVFSNVFADIIKLLDAGEDISDLFYDSYEEMKQDSPYMEYYLAHKDEQ